MTRRNIRRLLAVALIVATTGCAAHRNFRQAEIAAQLGNWDDAVLRYMEAVDKDPTNLRYQAALLRARIKASQAHFERAKQYKQAGVPERALVELQQAVELDPTNQYAEVELASVREQLTAARQGTRIDTIAEMKERTRGARPQPPVLNPRSNEPISLDFPEPTPIFQIYKALGDAFGINILFDQNLKDQEISISLEDVTAQTALETLMRAAGHFYKVIDEHTIIIAADTPQNRKIYEDLVIQTFFLSNADVKDMITILRSLIDSRQHRPQRAAQRHHPARHRRQGEGGRAHHRGQRQGPRRGGGGRRAAADRHQPHARARHPAVPVLDHPEPRPRRRGRAAAGLRPRVPQPVELGADHPQLHLQLRQALVERAAARPAAAAHPARARRRGR